MVGLLGLANKAGGFTPEDARMAAAFGEFASVALNNSRNLHSLEASETRFRSVVSTASDAILYIDERGTIVFSNPGVGPDLRLRAGRGGGAAADHPDARERYREAHEGAVGVQRLLATREPKLLRAGRSS